MSTVAITLLIGLAGLGLWIARQSFGLGTGTQKRVGLVEAAMIDGRRRLLLIRRDNVEHLILTGGPIDLVIETGINSAPHMQPGLSDALARSGHGAESESPIMTADVPLILHRDQPN